MRQLGRQGGTKPMELGLGLLLTPVKSPLLLDTPDTYPVYVLDSTSAQLSIGGVGSTVYPALIRQLHAPLITPLHAIYDQLNIAC